MGDHVKHIAHIALMKKSSELAKESPGSWSQSKQGALEKEVQGSPLAAEGTRFSFLRQLSLSHGRGHVKCFGGYELLQGGR